MNRGLVRVLMIARALMVLAVVGVAAGAVLADTVVMKNGDRITGKVIKLASGRLTVETAYMGKVEIDFAEVGSIVTEDRVAVKVQDGSLLVGVLGWRQGAQASVTSGEVVHTIPAGEVTAFGPVEGPGPVRWTGSFEMGISGQSGNSETLRGNAKLAVERKYERFAIEGYACGRYAREDGRQSDNQQSAGARTETQVGRRSFWYSSLDLERDEIKDLDLRTAVSFGIGHNWWKEDANYFKTGIGAGFTHESFRDDDDEIYPAAEVTAGYSRKLNGLLTFANDTKVLLDLNDIDGWRAENDACLSVSLTDNGSWKLKIGVNHEYDSSPAADIDRLDTYYYVNAVRKF
ncbi:MAG: DUF481 domain-containing protein [Planctomycetes bacterium]|nr:DUF481 domain-containing protein [Planctomycetota bacterium]